MARSPILCIPAFLLREINSFTFSRLAALAINLQGSIQRKLKNRI